MSDIERLRAIGKAATEGPWEATSNGRVLSLTWPCDDVAGRFGNEGAVVEASPRANATFIATARNEWDALLDRLEAAEAKVARCEALAYDWGDSQGDLGNDTFPIQNAADALRAALRGDA